MFYVIDLGSEVASFVHIETHGFCHGLQEFLALFLSVTAEHKSVASFEDFLLHFDLVVLVHGVI